MLVPVGEVEKVALVGGKSGVLALISLRAPFGFSAAL